MRQKWSGREVEKMYASERDGLQFEAFFISELKGNVGWFGKLVVKIGWEDGKGS